MITKSKIITVVQNLIIWALIHRPIKYNQKLDILNRLSLLNDWVKKYGINSFFNTRTHLYKYINHTILNNCPICYLEFGVYKGSSIMTWAGLNTNNNSKFVGFDSFEGPPDSTSHIHGKRRRGQYTTGGEIPATNDNRIRFVKGWFQDTLPSFLRSFSPDKQLIIHNDADLYSSTLFTLFTLNAFIKPGTIIIFDDFASILREFRALDDYTTSFWREYEVLGASATIYLGAVAIRITK